ncbi:hypothetical protein [Actinoplanes sp. N902-109]|uniref:hypothetical protein n=1 Tax=Actinoplanes sp. (strain N902-109) TaxID=649831 RepID=UPI00032938A4|nr:hypothetical protein [Actinoplanes sp. N902-109]AGL15313.1 hypothetical protein L083_1803 [Actinoplanes sp. N902-109]
MRPPAPASAAQGPRAGATGATAAEPYEAATQALRTATQWLIAAAAGVGGVLVAGLQLTGLGSLDDREFPRLAIALLGIVVALAAIGYMIRRASEILTIEWVTLADIDKEIFDQRIREGPPHRPVTRAGLPGRLSMVKNLRYRRDRQRREMLDDLRTRLDFIAEELFAAHAENVPDLYARLADANEAARNGQPARGAESAHELRQAASTVVAFANFYITRESFKALRRQLAGASAVVVIGILTFAYAAYPAAADDAGHEPAAMTVNSSTDDHSAGGRPA